MWMARIWTGNYKKAVTKWISVTTVIINDWIGHDQSKGFFSYVRSVLMAYVHWKASKAVRPAISSVSLMTLLTSDHLKCCCSAATISIISVTGQNNIYLLCMKPHICSQCKQLWIRLVASDLPIFDWLNMRHAIFSFINVWPWLP